MAFFTQDPSEPRLYTAQNVGDDRGWLGCVLPADVEHPASLELRQVFPGPELRATVLFAAAAPPLDPPALAQGLVRDVDAILATSPGNRAFLWLTRPREVNTTTVRAMPLRDDGTRSAAALNAGLVPIRLALQVGSFATLTLPDGSLTLRIDPTGNPIVFTGASRPDTGTIAFAELPFSGPQRGCLLFSVAIRRDSLAGPERLRWGFQMLYPIPGGDPPLASEWYPLAGDRPLPSDLVGFDASVDPADPVNATLPARTWFAFTGTTDQDGSLVPTVLDSCFRTRFGARLRLHPVGAGQGGGELRGARLSIALGADDAVKGTEFTLQPEGDFELEVPGSAATEQELLCGLSGTESITFRPRTAAAAGDRLRFTPGSPARATRFPLPEVSTVGPPLDPEAPLMDRGYLTAWATLRRDPGVSADAVYRVQPNGAPLYGREGVVREAWTGALGLVETGYRLPQAGELAFPLVPYTCVPSTGGPGEFGPGDVVRFEAQIVAPTRRRTIAGAGAKPAPVSPDLLVPATTPSGIAVVIDGATGAWTRVVLGRNQEPVPIELAFENPGPVLQQALQTDGLFMVVANGEHLGRPLGYPAPPLPPPAPAGAEFRNSMTIEEWAFAADVGRANRYADYRSVMIVKGGAARRGPAGESAGAGSIVDMVRNPGLWTAASTLGAPADVSGDPPVVGAPDPAELPVLSQWLQDYFARAAGRAGDPLYDRFNRIAADPAWTGVLVLRARVAAVPQQLRGLLGGIDPARFEAHHVGVEVSQVDGATVTLLGTSALFGLIDYRAEGYDPLQGARPIAPAPGETYDFKVLTLQALFDNAAVKDFRSLAQLTLNEAFALPVSRMGDPANPYNSIVLRGSYQHDGGVTTYVLDTEADNTFYLDSTVLPKVEVVKARFTTLAAGSAGAGTTAGRFDLWGFMDFAVLSQTVKDPSSGVETPHRLDLFSFGSPDGQDLPRQGLNFSGLGIGMTFPDDRPDERTLVFDAGKIAFDTGRSTARPGSLYRDFALTITGLAAGLGEATPAAQGFLRVATEVGLAGVTAPWYGLRFQLVMGTPGELAGRASLTSGVLAAWGRGSGGSYPAYAGLALPGTGGGAKLISLQGVLKLAVGELKLSHVPITGDPGGRRSYLLNLSDIALKFLGILKLPPNGSTQFYLFGNPDNQGKPGELGWYAIYNQDAPKLPPTPPPAGGTPLLAAAGAEADHV